MLLGFLLNFSEAKRCIFVFIIEVLKRGSGKLLYYGTVYLRVLGYFKKMFD